MQRASTIGKRNYDIAGIASEAFCIIASENDPLPKESSFHILLSPFRGNTRLGLGERDPKVCGKHSDGNFQPWRGKYPDLRLHNLCFADSSFELSNVELREVVDLAALERGSHKIAAFCLRRNSNELTSGP